MSFVHYPTWQFVPAGAFQAFQDASGARTVALAALVGFPNLAVAGFVARKGLPGVPGALLWVASALAALPWIVTPLYFIPLQGLLHEVGPAPDLIWRLTTADLFLRTAPPALQAGIYFQAFLRAPRVFGAAYSRPGAESRFRGRGPVFEASDDRFGDEARKNEHVGR
jgi:hypothetical protein